MGLQEERLSDRRAAMIDAARRLFVANGYDATSLIEVVRRSGGSLTTMYKLFGSKEGLLLAIFTDDPERPRFDRDIRALTEKGRVPADILMEIGGRLATRLSQPGFVALHRILIGQSLRDEEWAARLDGILGKPAEDSLTASFETWQVEGIVEPSHHPRELAAAFLSLIIYPFEAFAIRGRAAATSKDAVQRNIQRFIRGCFTPDHA